MCSSLVSDLSLEMRLLQVVSKKIQVMLDSYSVCADGMLYNTCLAVEFVDSLMALLFLTLATKACAMLCRRQTGGTYLMSSLWEPGNPASTVIQTGWTVPCTVAFRNLWISLRVSYVHAEVTVTGTVVLCPDPTL